jgi:hypothetical protein
MRQNTMSKMKATFEDVLDSMNARQLRALRRIRGGAGVAATCLRLRVEREEVLILAEAFRDVPDGILSDIERLLSDHMRLRRLITAIESAPRTVLSDLRSEKIANVADIFQHV